MIAELDPLYIKTRPGKALVRLISHLFFQGRFLTTKYRGLNSFLLAEMRFISAMPQLKTVRKPIYIMGMGRSGSTILGKVLSMHKEVGFLNEPKVIWYTVDKQDDVNGNFYLGPAKYRFDADDVTPVKRKTIQRIYGYYEAITGTDRIVDKNPEVIYRVPYVRQLFPDARFIFLVRNGWDTTYSTTLWSKREGRTVEGTVEDWWGADQRKWKFVLEQLIPSTSPLNMHQDEIAKFTRHEDMAAVEWTISAREGLQWLKNQPDAVHLVRYENLTEQPTQTLKTLLDFCELPSDPVFLEYAEKTLVGGRTHDVSEMVLSPIIKPIFLETMAELGYSQGK